MAILLSHRATKRLLLLFLLFLPAKFQPFSQVLRFHDSFNHAAWLLNYSLHVPLFREHQRHRHCPVMRKLRVQ